jgi:glucose-6-phosphate dehydrogenase assembly protein OpcA
MIIPLYATSVAQVNTRLVELRASSGISALARVATLVVACERSDLEPSIVAARAATMEHPCRVVVVTTEASTGPPTMDAQIRVGSDAGSGEVVVLRLLGKVANHANAVVAPLLTPEVPVVVWWPGLRPPVPAKSPLGRLADRRITDARANDSWEQALSTLAEGYHDGDTDMAWTRLSGWRSQLMAAYAQAPGLPVTSATVFGPRSASVELMAAWIGASLKVPVRREVTNRAALQAVQLNCSGGSRITIDKGHTQAGAVLHITGLPNQSLVLSRRSTPECLSEELRSFKPDPAYAQLATRGVPTYLALQNRQQA